MAFQPDSRLVSDVAPSPNHDARAKGCRLDMLLLHYTGMVTALAALARLRADKAPRVSAHYFVDEDGTIIQLVPEACRAWHAGAAVWAGETDINSRSIGVEIVNPGHDLGYPDFPPHQIAAVTALCKDIVTRRQIPPARVLAHSDVAPARKQDPGEKFPWRRLRVAGIGHWVEPAPIVEGPLLKPGARGEGVAALQTMLARYGYGTSVTGEFDSATALDVAAFQRHFRPQRVDGIADVSTLTTLTDLLAARSGVNA